MSAPEPTAATKWIRDMRALLLDVPRGWRIYGMDANLYAAGPISQAIIGDTDPSTASANGLQTCADWVDLGRITSAGGW